MITCRSLPRVQSHKLKGVDMAHELQHMRCKQFTGPDNFPDTLKKTGEGGGGGGVITDEVCTQIETVKQNVSVERNFNA